MRKIVRSWYGAFLHIFLVVLAVETGLLMRENRQLRAGGPPPDNSAELIGQQMRSFGATDLAGRSTTVELTASDTDSLLLLFTTTCPVCARVQPDWNALEARWGGQLRVLGLGFDDLELTRAFAQQHDLPYPVVVPEDRPSFASRYGIRTVPRTILVGPDGSVKGQWTGILPKDFDDQLRRAAKLEIAGAVS